MRQLLTPLIAVPLLILAAACDGSDGDTRRAENAPPPAPPPPMSEAAAGGARGFADTSERARLQFTADEGRAPTADGAAPTIDELAAAGALLAYQYSVQMTLPVANVRTTMDAHVERCRAAGPSVCQLLGANVNESGTDYVYGNLELRAEPGWLQTFRDTLAADANEAGGRITASNVSAEDLTAAITDTESLLAARTTLRDRLLQILETQPGEMAELLAVERELSRVQGEIDGAASRLEVMRRRVEMSRLSLSYVSEREVFRPSAFNPLGEAVENFFGYASETLAFLVRLLGFLLPVIILAAPLVWWLRRVLRRRRARRAEAEAA